MIYRRASIEKQTLLLIGMIQGVTTRNQQGRERSRYENKNKTSKTEIWILPLCQESPHDTLHLFNADKIK